MLSSMLVFSFLCLPASFQAVAAAQSGLLSHKGIILDENRNEHHGLLLSEKGVI
jgi:hypothetical protein